MSQDNDNEIFLGRQKQLDLFEDTLGALYHATETPGMPTVLLISGQGGMGKTTLLRHYLDRLNSESFSRCQSLHVDWQDEKSISGIAFSGDAYQVEFRDVADSIHGALMKCSNASRKTTYSKEVDALKKAANKFEKQLNTHRVKFSQADASDENDRKLAEWGAFRKAVAITLGPLPVEIDLEYITSRLQKCGISMSQGLAEYALPLIGQASLEELLNTDHRLAKSLGEAIRNVSSPDKPLVVSFDTYEIVDERDPLIQRVIQEAGPYVLWIMAGRRDLFETRTNTPVGRVNGYREHVGHLYNVERLDLTALAKEDIRTFFKRCSPERSELDDEELDRVDIATRAIPLAIRLAAEIWAKSGDLDDVTGDDQDSVGRDIVEEMVGRYQQHCAESELDRHSLAAIALADGDDKLLQVMLEPECVPAEDEEQDAAYRRQIKHVRHRYAAVQRREAAGIRLHDEPTQYYRNYLRDAEHRNRSWVKEFHFRAVRYLGELLEGLIRHHDGLDSLVADKDYVRNSVVLFRHLLALDEDQASRWLCCRYLEGLLYSSSFIDALLEEAAPWSPHFRHDRTRQRLSSMTAAHKYRYRDVEQQKLQDMLGADEKRDWFKDEILESPYDEERKSIRRWHAAEVFLRMGKLDEALQEIRISISMVEESSNELRKRICSTSKSLLFQFYKKKRYEEALSASEVACRCESVGF